MRQLARSSSQLLPSWSPDSTHIAYQSGGRIYTIARNGTGRRSVAAGLYPDWSPDGSSVAYVRDGALRVASRVLTTGVIGKPDWSPDAIELAFPRSDGIHAVSLAGSERLVAQTSGEPSAPLFSPHGAKIAYAVGGRVYVVAADGASPPVEVAGPYASLSPLSWSQMNDALAYTADGRLRVTWLSSPPRTEVGGRAEAGASYAHGDLNGYALAVSSPLPRCPGHSGILAGAGLLSGTCTIAGTAGADTVEGTPREGDVILGGAGNDRIHANDGHTDRVDCGPGSDTVWADRSDRLRACEVVHH